jgi:hypothetical protein
MDEVNATIKITFDDIPSNVRSLIIVLYVLLILTCAYVLLQIVEKILKCITYVHEGSNGYIDSN